MMTRPALGGAEIQQGKVLNTEHWAFNFLVRRGAVRELYDGLDISVVSYRLEPVGSFEVELDWVDGLATLLLCDDPAEWPGAGIMSRDGRPVRRTFTRALDMAEIPMTDLRRRCRDVPAEWGTARMVCLLEATARTLREHVDEIVDSWSAIFPSTSMALLRA